MAVGGAFPSAKPWFEIDFDFDLIWGVVLPTQYAHIHQSKFRTFWQMEAGTGLTRFGVLNPAVELAGGACSEPVQTSTRPLELLYALFSHLQTVNSVLVI